MLSQKEYFQRAANIAQYILNNGNKNGNWIEDRLESSIKHGTNPYYNVIPNDGSLLLEMYYGLPNKFHTPLGTFQFGGSGSGDHTELMYDLKIKLGLIEIVPGKQYDWGYLGPIYAVTKDLDGNSFPEPTYPRHRITLDYHMSKVTWEDVKPSLGIARAKNKQYENDSSEITTRTKYQSML